MFNTVTIGAFNDGLTDPYKHSPSPVTHQIEQKFRRRRLCFFKCRNPHKKKYLYVKCILIIEVINPGDISVTEDDMYKVFNSLKINKSPSTDGIHPNLSK